MIVSFANKTAREVWEYDASRGLPRDLWIRAKALLTILHNTRVLNDLRVKGESPNIRLHKLKGAARNRWSVTLKLPWCITFRFADGEFADVSSQQRVRCDYATLATW